MDTFHGTTILSARRGNRVALGGDGQVTLGHVVVKGGMILIDDYFIWDGCSRAVHDYLSKTQSTDRIRHTPEGVAYLIKGAPNTYEKYLAQKSQRPAA